MTEPDASGSEALDTIIREVLDLQPSWSWQNTPQMQSRGVLIRRDGPNAVRSLLHVAFGDAPPFDLAVEGRDGTGRKTRIPWFRVHSKSRSPSATEGWYVVYLFALDGSAVYLSINQGTTNLQGGEFKSRPTEDLDARVEWARSVVDVEGAGLLQAIDLADEGGLATGYERGNVVAIRYERESVPATAQLTSDLSAMVTLLARIYEAPGEPAYSTPSVVPPPSKPLLDDIGAFIQLRRDVYGPSLVPSRRAAENEARALLDADAGRMTREQAIKLGELFNTGDWAGVPHRNRFAPAFTGATMEKLIDPLETFNVATQRLWRAPFADALTFTDEILSTPSVLGGAGPSYPTMLLYLRDPSQYVIWLNITQRGLHELGRLEDETRKGGIASYLQYCKAAVEFAAEFGLEAQEIDAVLVDVARWAAEEKSADAAEKAALVDAVDEHGEEPAPGTAYPLTHVAALTYLPIERLEEWVALLRGRKKKQALFYGPPGTGKTFVAQQLGRHLAGDDGEVETVQFHPSFSYEDFVEGLRPVVPKVDAGGAETSISYEVRPGVFARFCEKARDRGAATFVFIIDELNRAELGAVLGELMMLLEYRGKALPLPYSQKSFSVPENVIVLATMNTADRSLALVDFALRRRFHAIQMLPDREVLEKHLAATVQGDELVLDFFDLVQQTVDNRDFAPGHSYWMDDDVSAQGLDRVWRYELHPYLAEYWFEHQSRLADLDAQVVKLLAQEA